MGDSSDGSSNAAQRAQSSVPAPDTGTAGQHSPIKSQAARGGFWRRVFGRGGSDDGKAHQDAPSGAARDSTSVVPVTHGMINLRRMRVEDVMVPSADVVSVPATITRDDLVTTFRDSGMTRIPVYNGTLDTPLGFVHLKDFALRFGFNGVEGRFILKDMLRPLLFVPPSMPIGVLLQKMQTERRHMALVIDEYGGVDGLVTIEDLIEQVIGEIEDEHDIDEGEFWIHERGGSYLAQAKAPLAEFETELGLSLTEDESIDEEEIDTLGGLVFMLLGRVPVRGEVVTHPAGVEIEVVDADPRRIKRLRVRPSGGTEQAAE
ncbi:magnesium/cobalt efflux protein [Litorivita pollutaquae]|uniref:Magnesium/cobalt efflux protein n=1 Tax=Litorivita pollutaquae TaxID=2200892 RepID=A0A2V4MXW3_9RHOB|nr:hemolysin family protein [Litorivita pollutaquae]OUS20315.1 magnesium/cobalt efflux protein [Rhodobacterales bacterium 59_46_T64]PYC46482.1 magnesium/cobalt efflux protein [Litorivita pollutaquae]